MVATPTARRMKNPWVRLAKMYAALRTAAEGFGGSRQGISRHGREYTVRAAFSREGEIMAPPRVTYSSHDVLVEVRRRRD